MEARGRTEQGGKDGDERTSHAPRQQQQQQEREETRKEHGRACYREPGDYP